MIAYSNDTAPVESTLMPLIADAGAIHPEDSRGGGLLFARDVAAST